MSLFAENWFSAYNSLRIKQFDSRRITNAIFESVLKELQALDYNIIGKSAENRPIYKLKIGTGTKNVLAWACMHGNETTSLRGWMDLFANQHSEPVLSGFNDILNEFTIHFIPILNPDGAEHYSRRNAMAIDMNRDARALVTPEMQVLINQIKGLKPAVAFNLHDQRNIFTAGDLPATISFLAPSVDVERTVTQERKITMDLIGAASKAIRPILTGGVGRYTDEYYPTAIGERIQQMGIPTILVECGPAKNDPLRQEARMLNAVILQAVLNRFSKINQPDTDTYFNIPVNKTNQADIVIRKVLFKSNRSAFYADISLLEELVLKNSTLVQQFRILDLGDLSHQKGLLECDFVSSKRPPNISPGNLADFELLTTAGELVFVDGLKMNTPA